MDQCFGFFLIHDLESGTCTDLCRVLFVYLLSEVYFCAGIIYVSSLWKLISFIGCFND